jgi:hypothetical protein
MGPLERANFNHWTEITLRDPTEYTYPSYDLKMETDPLSETLCFLMFRIQGEVNIPKIRVIYFTLY